MTRDAKSTKGAKGKQGTKAAKGAKRAQARPRVLLEKSAGAVVVYRATQLEYLLILSTYWEFPKGLVEVHESETEAAVREVREETGLDVKLLPGFRQEINYFYRRGGNLIKKQVVYFLGEAASQEVQVSWEHHDAQWLTFEAALAELKYENAREVLKKANEFLTDGGRRTNDTGPPSFVLRRWSL
jgi:bis(5'-nucleosidyl)-tetraphosphatase